jgi:hypothetical protein
VNVHKNTAVSDPVATGHAPDFDPEIAGTPKVGNVLSAIDVPNAGQGWDNAYKWYRGVTLINGATSSDYRAEPEDLGLTITVEVTASRDGFASATQVSFPTAAVALGDATEFTPTLVYYGPLDTDTLVSVASIPLDSGDVDFSIALHAVSYQWMLDGITAIAAGSGGASPTYTIRPEDVGHKLSVEVRVARDGYQLSTGTSAQTTPVVKAPAQDFPISLVGDSRVGSVLKLTGIPDPEVGWTVDDIVWVREEMRSSTILSDQDGEENYQLVAEDLDARMSVMLVLERPGYEDSFAYAPSEIVQLGYAPVFSPYLSASGVGAGTSTAQVGKTLLASGGPVSSFGYDIHYQWLLDGVPIPGETFASHTVAAYELSRNLSVRIYGEVEGYEDADQSSAPNVTVSPGAAISFTPYLDQPTPGLTRVLGAPDPATGWTVSYQWFGAGSPISGATTAYLWDAPTGATCRVTATRSGYQSASY